MKLGPYIEQIRDQCDSLSRDQLIELMSKLAEEIPSGRRTQFLQQFNQFFREVCGTSECGDSTGSRELEDYFSVAGQLFTARKLGSATELYRTLFELFGGAVGEEESEEYAATLSRGDIGINFREEWARFYRCVYETAAPEERLHSVLKAMSINAALHTGRFVPGEEVLPLMQDVIDTLPEELPDWDEFLPEWRDALSRVSSDRAQLLLLEATSKIEGTSGVADLAKKWGADQPRGYLFWMRRLAGSESWRELIPVGLEALDRLKPKDEFRLQVADMLIEAAENASDRD